MTPKPRTEEREDLRRIRATYDPEVGAASICLIDATAWRSARTVEAAEDVLLDYDDKGVLCAIELLAPSSRLHNLAPVAAEHGFAIYSVLGTVLSMQASPPHRLINAESETRVRLA